MKKLPQILCLTFFSYFAWTTLGVAAEEEKAPSFLEMKKKMESSPAPAVAPASAQANPAAAQNPPEKKRKKRLKAEAPPVHKAAVRETQEETPIPASPQEVETRLTKNWGGSRKALSEKGIDLALIYKGEVNSILSRGKKKTTEYLDNIDLRASMDGEKTIGWKGGSAFIYLLANHGGDPSKNVGDVQGTSNIEMPVDAFKLYEAWLQQLLYEGKVSILAGLHDLNSEFYVTDSSGLFFNSSFGVGKELAQTGANGPSIFPTTAPALRIRTEPSKSFYMQWAAFNGQAGDPLHPKGTHIRLNANDGLLLISELAYIRGKEDAAQLPAKYGIGYWSYTATFDHLSETISTDPSDPTATVPVKSTSHGVYFLFDQSLAENFSLFFRYGIASTEVNPVHYCIGAGTVITGPLPSRDRDRLGLSVAQVEYGDTYRSAQASAGAPIKGGETTFELNYRAEVARGVAVQPDLQYVKYPSGNEDMNHATVLAVRLEVSF